jgi:hypothetical protein
VLADAEEGNRKDRKNSKIDENATKNYCKLGK